MLEKLNPKSFFDRTHSWQNLISLGQCHTFQKKIDILLSTSPSKASENPKISLTNQATNLVRLKTITIMMIFMLAFTMMLTMKNVWMMIILGGEDLSHHIEVRKFIFLFALSFVRLERTNITSQRAMKQNCKRKRENVPSYPL